MTRDEYDQLSDRITEINNEIRRLMQEFQQAGGSMMNARIDAAAWAERLQPLFDEHHEIAERLKREAVED